MEGLRALDDGGDVLEDDARLGEVGDVEDEEGGRWPSSCPFRRNAELERPWFSSNAGGSRFHKKNGPGLRKRWYTGVAKTRSVLSKPGAFFLGYTKARGPSIDFSLYLVADADFAAGPHRPRRRGRSRRRDRGPAPGRRSLGGRAFSSSRSGRGALAGTGVPLLINDRVDIALACGAAGVHLGQDDMPVPAARRILGPDAIDRCLRQHARRGGSGRSAKARTTSAPDRPSRPRRKRRLSPCSDRRASAGSSAPSASPSWPSAASRPANAASLAAAGADGVAVVSAILGAPDRAERRKNPPGAFKSRA